MVTASCELDVIPLSMRRLMADELEDERRTAREEYEQLLERSASSAHEEYVQAWRHADRRQHGPVAVPKLLERSSSAGRSASSGVLGVLRAPPPGHSGRSRDTAAVESNWPTMTRSVRIQRSPHLTIHKDKRSSLQNSVSETHDGLDFFLRPVCATHLNTPRCRTKQDTDSSPLAHVAPRDSRLLNKRDVMTWHGHGDARMGMPMRTSPREYAPCVHKSCGYANVASKCTPWLACYMHDPVEPAGSRTAAP
jgi:peptidoglycan/xylan/chitin deacetylase (PgdA/CDA1 family)